MGKRILFMTLASVFLFASCTSSGIDGAMLGFINVYWLIAAVAGGMFGSAIGPNFAFGFTGVLILLGIPVSMITGSTVALDYIAFGPVFGPHISFAGGVAASAYAAKIGQLKTGGKDVNAQLVALNNPTVLWVGGLFGAFGYIVLELTKLIPWLGSHTDNVALTVFTSGMVVRALFGVKTRSIISTNLKTDDENCWLRWQEKLGQLLTVSLMASTLSAGLVVAVHYYLDKTGVNLPGADILKANVQTIPFAISALCIFFVSMGYKYPVTHHMTVTAGLAASVFYPLLGSAFAAVGVGVFFGVFSGLMCELNARIFYNRGDTHIDPPASIIWFSTAMIFLAAAAV